MGERKILLDRIKNNLQKLFVIRYSLFVIRYSLFVNFRLLIAKSLFDLSIQNIPNYIILFRMTNDSFHKQNYLH
jgi:hypothetical protein